MKVIGAGLPRTATLSQKLALEQLGVGPCYHMVNVLGDLSQAEYWLDALDGKPRWDEVLGGFQSTVDWPGGFFYKELMEQYPEAKVLLSVRDENKWDASIRETVWDFRNGDSLMSNLAQARAKVDPGWARFMEMIDGLLWTGNGTFADGHHTSKERIAAMQKHNEEVKATVPSDRLLVWTASDGWEPLCEFLELPVPSEPFPNVNDKKDFAERVVNAAIDTLADWKAKQA